MNNKIITFFLVILLSSCVTYKYKKQGFVTKKEYLKEIPFTYENGFIFIPVTIQEKEYNFLFDTGAELNLIDPTISSELNVKQLKKGTVSNGSDSVKKVERVQINSIQIAGIEFQETVSLIWDVSKFGKYIRCKKIDGIIGNNLMRKANWQIDYKKQLIRITDNNERFEISDNSEKIKMNSEDVGNVYLNLKIGQKSNYFTFDTGYNGFIQTGDTTLLKDSPSITKVGLEGVNFTGAKQGETHIKKIDSFHINELPFKKPSYLLIKPRNSSLLGNEFYENYIIIIDWKNDYLVLDKTEKIDTILPNIYEVGFFTDYENSTVTVANIYDKSKLVGKIKPNSKVLKINNIDLIELKRTGEFCDFWKKEWKNLITNDILKIVVESDGIQQTVEINKIKIPW
ncbi:retropepsin-like aspartic protease [Polaribacter undariae]|uniref:Retropepsin-like aspartic protease n=1 Tax=Polaribacter sejongensis TaxID=985043 RepID=A0AAJ1QVS0_9FLAO|nr:retropepsin-like aspartic protease [Polaribacter undariae]MDN3619030.1 retropepsin-like aspartic protease [Polaribacter undariae]UWD33116.1 retroviral-like aspartic protease family protein [Polaribacter undariae]